MTRISFHDRSGAVSLPPLAGAAARAALWEFGIRCGSWPLRSQPVSQMPQLTYARELGELQHLHDIVLTDRVRQRAGARCGDPRDHHSVAWPDQRHEHTHADAEVRVILEGRARWVVRAPAAGGWLALQCEAGDWLALPAGLPHIFEASPTSGVELLRLFGRPGGWVAERTAAQVPQALLPWREGEDQPAAAWGRAA